MKRTREEQYEQKRNALLQECANCRKCSQPSIDRCNYHCTIGQKLRWLETEYSDVTGWSHDKW